MGANGHFAELGWTGTRVFLLELPPTGTRPALTNMSRKVCSWAAALLSTGAAVTVHAASFSQAYYEPKTNELVVTIIYGGTNPDHEFSVEWGECGSLGDDGSQHEIAARILDSQWGDEEQQTFTKTVRFSLANVNCRPATVTLLTAPRFEYTTRIP